MIADCPPNRRPPLSLWGKREGGAILSLHANPPIPCLGRFSRGMQFGVGFYSAFLVADKLRVQSRCHETADEQWCWEADAGSHKYTIRADTDKSLVRGTR